MRSLASWASAGLLKSHLRKRDSELLRHSPHSFRERDVFDFLDEVEYIARHSASEAVIELPGGMNRKRRCLFVVEWTESRIVLRAGFFQLDVVADDPDDVRLLLDDFLKICGVSHR